MDWPWACEHVIEGCNNWLTPRILWRNIRAISLMPKATHTVPLFLLLWSVAPAQPGLHRVVARIRLVVTHFLISSNVQGVHRSLHVTMADRTLFAPKRKASATGMYCHLWQGMSMYVYHCLPIVAGNIYWPVCVGLLRSRWRSWSIPPGFHPLPERRGTYGWGRVHLERSQWLYLLQFCSHR